MIVYEAESADEAQALLDADPYTNAGVIANARIRPWTIVLQAGS